MAMAFGDGYLFSESFLIDAAFVMLMGLAV